MLISSHSSIVDLFVASDRQIFFTIGFSGGFVVDVRFLDVREYEVLMLIDEFSFFSWLRLGAQKDEQSSSTRSRSNSSIRNALSEKYKRIQFSRSSVMYRNE